MGTNRSSRRRSAARILNASINIKRQRRTHEFEEDCENFPPPNSPALSDPSSGIEETQSTTDSADLSSTPTRHYEDTPDASNPGGPVKLGWNVPNFTSAEICSFELMDLLDNAGCPLNTYEQVVCLLRKQEKLGFSYSRAHSRDKLLSLLRQKFHCPSISSTIISKCEVFSFPFVDMLQDLVDTTWNHLHHISPQSCIDDNSDELWNSKWMKETFQHPRYNNFNPDNDVMLPIILYLDKTGTDVLQRYSLEPMLFTTAALNRESRENRRFWRHLGFIPSSKCMEDSKDSLEFYHQCLTVILRGLKAAQENPPRLTDKGN